MSKETSAKVELLDWATAQFWAEYCVSLGGEEFGVAVSFYDGYCFDVTVTDSTGADIDGEEFATMLGYRDAADLCVDLTDGMFSAPRARFTLQAGTVEVAR